MAKDTLVVVTATVSGSRGDGMRVNMHVSHHRRNQSLFFLGLSMQSANPLSLGNRSETRTGTSMESHRMSLVSRERCSPPTRMLHSMFALRTS